MRIQNSGCYNLQGKSQVAVKNGLAGVGNPLENT